MQYMILDTHENKDCTKLDTPYGILDTHLINTDSIWDIRYSTYIYTYTVYIYIYICIYIHTHENKQMASYSFQLFRFNGLPGLLCRTTISDPRPDDLIGAKGQRSPQWSWWRVVISGE